MPYYARFTDKHFTAHQRLACIREYRKTIKRSWIEVNEWYDAAKHDVMDCFDSDSDLDPAFIFTKVQKKEDKDQKWKELMFWLDMRYCNILVHINIKVLDYI